MERIEPQRFPVPPPRPFVPPDDMVGVPATASAPPPTRPPAPKVPSAPGPSAPGVAGSDDALVVGRGPVDVDRLPPNDVIAPEAGPWQAAPPEVPPPRPPGDELVMERIEPQRFPRPEPPTFVPPEAPVAVPPPPEPMVGLDDAGIEIGTPPASGVPGFGPEVPDIPRVPHVSVEDIEMRLPDVDGVPVPSVVDDVEIDLGVGARPGVDVPAAPVPRAPGVSVEDIEMQLPDVDGAPVPSVADDVEIDLGVGAPPDLDAGPAPAPTPAPPPEPRPPKQDLMEAAMRGDPTVPDDAVEGFTLRGEERFSGTQHAGEAGWSVESITRGHGFYRSDGSLIVGGDAIDVLPGRGQYNFDYDPRTDKIMVRWGEGFSPSQRRGLLRPGGPIEQAIAKIRNPGVPDGT